MPDVVALPRRKPLVLADLVPGTLVRDALLVVGAAGLVGLLAQVSVHLPFTPVPVTGQTLGVLLCGTALGWRRGAAAHLCCPRPPRAAIFARCEFGVVKPLARARLYATALGAYEVYLNGGRLGTARLSPEITVANNHVLYQCYDATDQVHPGRNALGALIGDGWYASAFSWTNERYSLAGSPRRFLAQLVLEYTDGSRDVPQALRANPHRSSLGCILDDCARAKKSRRPRGRRPMDCEQTD